MPTKNVQFTGGTLYFGNPETDEILGEINDVKEVKMEAEEPSVDVKKFHLGGEATITVEIDRNSILSIIYGEKITNNWLKMHGGVMSRKGARRRKHRRNISR